MEFLCSYYEATSNSAEQRAKTRHLQKYVSCPLSRILVAFSAKCPLTQMRLFIALLLYLARSDQPIVAAHWPGLIIVLTSRMPSTPGTVYLQSAAVGRRYTSLALLFMAGGELPKPGLQSPRVEQWSCTQLYLWHCSGFLKPSGRYSLSSLYGRVQRSVYQPYFQNSLRPFFAFNMCAISYMYQTLLSVHQCSTFTFNCILQISSRPVRFHPTMRQGIAHCLPLGRCTY